jgi:micrococcal nuclease
MRWLAVCLFLAASSAGAADSVEFPNGATWCNVEVLDARECGGAPLVLLARRTSNSLEQRWYGGVLHIDFDGAAPASSATYRACRPPSAGRVARAVDGDTLALATGQRVRLIGVNAPETARANAVARPGGRDAVARPGGRADAKPTDPPFARQAAAVAQRLAAGRSVWLEFDRAPTDAYGRWLAFVYVLPDGLFLNERLIAEGAGRAYTRYPFRADYMERFLAVEREARAAGLGLWAAHGSHPTGPWVWITYSGKRFHTTTCRCLAHSRIPITLAQAVEQGYTPCRICRGP